QQPLIGIMQGRLVPPENSAIQAFPRQRWRDEFELASQAGLDCIEWIYDGYGADINPLNSAEGLQELTQLSRQHEIRIASICADYFMENPLIGVAAQQQRERIDHLIWLIGQAKHLGVR